MFSPIWFLDASALAKAGMNERGNGRLGERFMPAVLKTAVGNTTDGFESLTFRQL